MVALTHLGAAGHFHEWPFIRNGARGVDFFFVLSGFVMAHAYEGRLTDMASAKEFLIRRFGRLYPLHLATLSFMVLLEVAKFIVMARSGVVAGEPPFAGSSSLTALLGNLVLVNGLGFFSTFTWNVPSWSISTEFYVYLLFLAATLAAPAYIARTAAVIATMAGLGLFANAMSADPLRLIEGAGLLSCIYGFFLGIVTLHLYRRLRARVEMPGYVDWAALAIVAIVFLAPESPVSPVLTPMAFVAVIMIFAGDHGPVSRLMQRPIPQHLGRISYSMYLVHFPLLAAMNGVLRAVEKILHIPLYAKGTAQPMLIVGGPWAMDLLAASFVLILIAVSSVTYRWIEEPARLAFNRLAKRRREAV